MVEIHDISPSTDKWRVFDDDDEIYNFYKEYAKKLGFPVHRIGKKRNDDGCLRCVFWLCKRR
ncbi:hypothetical protein MKW98_025995 [Papaver atlanticum]|uniref:FAR1 domain-containing protein n=1 Tax=Papaver atlanticum TaxID=357466 RepID=A0AAD4X4L1_9MAGN|nr:hypothetical protein MKW98_025995 [Papaver atlanticum]